MSDPRSAARPPIRLIDTTLRDGQQSLWAIRMPTKAMLPAMEDLDAAGYDGVEFLSPGGGFARTIRDLHEHPWDRLQAGTARVRHTPLRLHGSLKSLFSPVPECVRELFMSLLPELGITITRTSDPWNDFDEFSDVIDSMRRHGIETVANIIYSISPRHTPEYYAERARDAVEARSFRICIKDVAGLMTAETGERVIRAVLENAGGIPVEFHAHSNNGFAPYLALRAAELGVSYVHTAIPPLANGPSQPSVFSVVRNLRARGVAVAIDIDPLERVSRHLHHVASVEDLPLGVPAEYDESVMRHQVPGGMISNLQLQLEQIGMGERLAEVLEEIERVRTDLGFPIMVTPLSQFVGSQAMINVLTSGRYETVSDEVIEYAQGRWGKEASLVMDQTIKDKILARPRTGQLARRERVEPSLREVRAAYGNPSDVDLIVRVYGGIRGGELPPRVAYPPTYRYEDYEREHSPVMTVLRQLQTSARVGSVNFRYPGGSLSAQRGPRAGG